MNFDIGENLKNSAKALVDFEYLKWGAANFASYLAIAVAAIMLIGVPLFVFIWALGGPASAGGRPWDDSPSFAMALILLAFLAFATLAVACALAWMYFTMRISKRALELEGYGKPLQAADFRGYVKAGLIGFAVKVFCWFDRRFLAGFAACYIIGGTCIAWGISSQAAGGAKGISLALGALIAFAGLMVHAAGIVYHRSRLALCPFAYLQYKITPEECAQVSWDAMKGKSIDSFLILLIGNAVIWIPYFPLVLVALVIPGGSLLSSFYNYIAWMAGTRYEVAIFRHFDPFIKKKLVLKK